jgi:hypothetical protein
LLKILEQGKRNVGSGGFFLYNDVLKHDLQGKWILNKKEIDPAQTYRVAISDFLLTGKEANLDFLTENNPAITKVYSAETSIGNPLSDIRLAVIGYLDFVGNREIKVDSR